MNWFLSNKPQAPKTPFEHFGFISRSQMERAVRKERSRCDRSSQAFTFVVLGLHGDETDLQLGMRIMARILDRRLRLTDERCVWSESELALMLPVTDRVGSETLVASLTRLAAEQEVYFTVKITSYPESDNSSESSSGNPGIREQSGVRSVSKSWDVPEDAIALFSSSPYPGWKRAIDLVGSSVGLVLAAPLIAFFSALILATSRGPVFFRQERTGYRGRTFTMYKLRSMVVGAEEQQSHLAEKNERDGPAFKMRKDPRVTAVGRILRATGFDELPQLWNILRGDMAIVGPRPLPCVEDAQCENWQRRRLDTKPGLTCFWQTSKDRNVPFADWMRMDLNYLRRRSFLLDIQILTRTVTAVILGRVGH